MDQNVVPRILDSRGQPLTRMAVDRPHDGASNINAEVAGWQPQYYSADAEILQDRAKLLARTQDLIRNNGLTSGAVQSHLDWVIGSGLQLNAKPDWLLLGVKDKKKAREWERDTEAKFRAYAEDPDLYFDAARGMRFSELTAQAYRSYLSAFEICQTVEWLPNRGSTYATAIQSIDPMRVSNPNGISDTDTLRDGVKMDEFGAPIGYWVCNRVPNDSLMTSSAKLQTWKYVPRETSWGRPMFLHIYDRERPGQSRGKNTGVIASLSKMKMHEKLGAVTLQQSIINAMFATAIESSLDWTSVGAAVGTVGNVNPNDPVVQYMSDRSEFHKDHTIRINGARMPHLYPGEKISMQSPAHPTVAFSEFERSVLRYCAAGWNMPFEMLSRDYSQTNYTGFRAAMLTAWQFFASRQYFIAGRNASLIYSLWLEEAMDKGLVETLPGAPSFWEAKAAWCGAEWIGPGRGTLDPLREANATKVDFSMGLTTLEVEASARGRRWEQLLEQTAQEIAYRRELEIEYELEEGALDQTPVDAPTGDEAQPNNEVVPADKPKQPVKGE